MYIPISRKYRPQDFDTIAGQDHVTRTLKNAVAMDRVAHAYLFSGGRGVGKTTTARVLAKALNCEKGPTVKPCNKCIACTEIARGSSLDVLEIDGASNRGIDEIRNLRENVKLKPVSGRYRIYIIDEVHMLTAEAFNALLKTLEEPPEHVKFFFATTRPYKILPTILSRCQRFDFHMIPVATIVERLKEVVRHEKLLVSEDALFLIAKKAEGSMRDAQVMLDQITSASKDEVTGETVSSMLGMLDEEVLARITEAMLEGRSREVLKLVNELVDSGKDAFLITSSLIEHFRNLMVISACGKGGKHLSVNEDERKRLEELSGKISLEEIFYAVYTLSNALEVIGKTPLGKVPLEVALLKLSQKGKLMPMSELVDRLEKLEGALSGAALPNMPFPAGHAAVPPARKAAPDEGYAAVEEPADEPLQETTDLKANMSEYSEEAKFQRLKGVWPEIVREAKTRKMSAGTYLEEGYLLDLKDNIIKVGFGRANSLHKEALDSKQNKSIIIQILKDFMEADFGIEFVSSDNGNESGSGNTDQAARAEAARPAAGPGHGDVSRKMDPIIHAAIERFEGTIVKQYYVKKKEEKGI
ncbi:MAG: DNA polymerase III subunit gamma/tau [Candidatus Omnitrophota bacterium]